MRCKKSLIEGPVASLPRASADRGGGGSDSSQKREARSNSDCSLGLGRFRLCAHGVQSAMHDSKAM
eukprot:4668239-Pleurochrysis_carterae.AAC.2